MKKKVKTQEKKIGRPTKYSDALADEICKVISVADKGLVHICKTHEHFPTPQTINSWVRNNDSFLSKYARAREDQAQFLAEQILEISDDTSRDTDINEEGKEVQNTEWVNRSRLRIDARKWMASKLAPKKYGDKLDVTSNGEQIALNVTASPEGKKAIDKIS